MLRFTTLLLTAVLVTGCASQQLANQDALSALASAKASEFGSDSERALDQARAAYQRAVEEELSFYAPLTMQQLEAALKKAQEKELASESDASIRASAKVVTLLDNGLKNKATAQQLLAPLFSEKDVLDGIRAANVLPADYREKMEDLSDLIRLIEAGSSSKALEKSHGLLTELNTLELNTMLALHWKPAAKTLDKAEDEDADDNAPQVFTLAEDKVEQAEIFIRQNYRDRQQSQATGLDALRAAQHALFIGREARRLQKMNSESAEQAALKQEDLLHQIAATAGVGDIRYMAFRDQTLAIIQHIQEEQRALAAQAKPVLPQTTAAAGARTEQAADAETSDEAADDESTAINSDAQDEADEQNSLDEHAMEELENEQNALDNRLRDEQSDYDEQYQQESAEE